ncbi:hypothetical protein CXG81DRAFT_29749 [Caulochytrium protostelioides]|uniref:Proteasome subunit beta n=1 Tax=Caulochytrium protostelioides TaxID=1555241 RepID=A0A4P9X852_9FUNG|nr:N-terminal nucleophile aminohydrolase [Caulochytrium protostelioides]RKP01446.1 hypothetical protein CXG81DRAFT_29749 [Caulochytrium protostelioides]|eukprot:RKP01446.1 hypothetical protein CXG81DRAFT_29749 [Caulochytrium protostelioides]
MVTGTSVLGIKYKDGIMMAADTLASYGSLARFRDVQRIVPVGEHTLLGASGEMSDFAYIQEQLDKLLVADHLAADGHTAGPHFIWQYLSRLMYARRSRVNPLWNSLIVGGFRDGKRFLGFVDLQGTTYEASTIATGFGAYLGQPLLRKAVEGKEDTLTKEEAHKLLVDTLRVLYYRDARSLDKIQIATADASGVSVSEPFKLDSDWSFGADIRGYGAL